MLFAQSLFFGEPIDASLVLVIEHAVLYFYLKSVKGVHHVGKLDFESLA